MMRLCLLVWGGLMKASAGKTLWQIGKADHSGAELALGPSDYKQFLSKDFG